MPLPRILINAFLLFHAVSLSAAGDELMQQAQSWLEAREGLPAGTPQLDDPDPRLVIPACPEGFSFDLPFSGQSNLLARCNRLDWSLYLQVRYISARAAALSFTRDLPAGHQLKAQDLSGDTPTGDVLGRFLRSAVRSGQLLGPALLDDAVTVFRTRSALARHSTITVDSLLEVQAPARVYPPARRVARSALIGARASRDLPAGSILAPQDILRRQRVLKASVPIARGAVVSADNTVEEDVWGTVPQDALNAAEQLPRAVATTLLTSGDVIRRSALRLLPAVAKGDLVGVGVARNQVSVEVKLRAEQDGQIGEQIYFLNEDSGTRIQAIVTGVGSAQIP